MPDFKNRQSVFYGLFIFLLYELNFWGKPRKLDLRKGKLSIIAIKKLGSGDTPHETALHLLLSFALPKVLAF